jgi:hypothetical protein
VVTSFTFQLHPVAQVFGGMIVHPIERAREVLRFYREFGRTAPDQLTLFAGMMTSPDGVKIIALVGAYNGSLEEGEQVLKPLREYGPPIADQMGPMPYTSLQSMLDDGFPAGLHVYWRSHFLKGIDNNAIDTLVERFGSVASPLSAVLLEHLAGAVARVPQDATAFDHRDAEYNLAIIGRWPDPAQAEANITWTRQLWSAMEPHSRGVYVNYLGIDEDVDRVRAAYGESKFTRLAALKRQYDPGNLFRFNQNIKPQPA